MERSFAWEEEESGATSIELSRWCKAACCEAHKGSRATTGHRIRFVLVVLDNMRVREGEEQTLAGCKFDSLTSCSFFCSCPSVDLRSCR
eukprot:286223-Rhodomonas_salina.1